MRRKYGTLRINAYTIKTTFGDLVSSPLFNGIASGIPNVLLQGNTGSFQFKIINRNPVIELKDRVKNRAALSAC
jgi:hypothetical protein